MRFGIRLLLFVALLLPFRGAMAVAGAWCHDPAAVPAIASANASHHGTAADVVHAPDAAGHHGHAHHAPTGDGSGPLSAPGASCTFCLALCAAPPLPGSPAAFHPLLPSGAERFAALDAPRSTLAFGAPERPPRRV